MVYVYKRWYILSARIRVILQIGCTHHAHSIRMHKVYACYYLYDEVADYSAVVRVHARAEGVEYPGHTHLHLCLTLICVPDMIGLGVGIREVG